MGDAAENLGPAPTLEHFKQFEHFCKALLDAYVVVDTTGRVLKCNPLLSNIVNAKTKQVLKADSFDELLKMEIAGKPLKIADLIDSPGPTALRRSQCQGRRQRSPQPDHRGLPVHRQQRVRRRLHPAPRRDRRDEFTGQVQAQSDAVDH